ncbi:metabolite traffic protein EboE [Streptomyces europaeiscabiei]|uniref:Metabolite traffic protein EboE n=1 Tax=Streptomyces europaeiscabiei TaxID=146819 RepID=A0ABU4N6Q2_9ACTN|nr:metabolite traffic protein EboE [Streptomyces europaeiscabiei]MDX2765939.1 metabolite traffic protein EboE [Streptomyces europaeiscabiei]MDX3541981.1 metabolite traffic protein EboE [Streptomyces europaeiscabiei]MDX3551029.1 metabolite traffic protein EboE [Streptomyces europaeiscabiei]MDX3698411.1 metabolite traffic protein EboE [Streptomyces europaeiscabiei]MDX3835767.1 metabolite traffic protein EboE [Streptomyces europaeiscabiei]
MRFRHPDGTAVHLGYCSNVHQAEDVDGVLAQLTDYAEPVRERLGVDRLGIGLWLARDVVSELVAVPGVLRRLKDELAARGLETVTLNAFPYAGFHREVVKKDVYLPDWADEARLAHTLDCARVLAALLPDDAERGSVSTLPLAWRTPWPPDRADTARRALDRLTAGLAGIESDTGRRIRVGFEPEPGCVVETTAQAVRELRGLDPERLGVCLDACHLAVQFEEPDAALRRLADAGLPVVKLQASCAVEATDPADPAARAALRRLAEPRFLHQTRTAAEPEAPQVRGVDDLPDALDGGLPTDTGPWRVHFHAPLHADPEPPLRTTADQLSRVLAGLLGGASADCDHIEVETYTWSVLPEPPTDLPGGIAAELAWARDRLTGLGLKEDQK